VHQHHVGCASVVLVGNIAHLVLGGAVNKALSSK
jgi:hypothetical protein